MKIIAIGIAGGSGSGKTTFAKKLLEQLPGGVAQILGQDNYYRDQSHKFDKDGGAVNFDHPDALELDLLAAQLQQLKTGKSIEVPQYCFATHKRLDESVLLEPSRILLVDGTLIFSNLNICSVLDELVFLHVDEETRYERRLKRDTQERGRTPEGVQEQFIKQVKPMHDQFVEPSMERANRVVQVHDFDHRVLELAKFLHDFL